MITQLPGFQGAVHDGQRTFRALLNALARPGLVQTTAVLTPPEGLVPSCAAATLTLLDLETTLWLQVGIPEAVRSWLLFHTGCRFTPDPHRADFALITDLATAPALTEFNFGNAEYPEASTTLLMQLPTLAGGAPVSLQGPGIQGAITVDLPVGDEFWLQWQAMGDRYPLGIDAWCFAGEQVVGLPRTSRLRAKNQQGAS